MEAEKIYLFYKLCLEASSDVNHYWTDAVYTCVQIARDNPLKALVLFRKNGVEYMCLNPLCLDEKKIIEYYLREGKDGIRSCFILDYKTQEIRKIPVWEVERLMAGLG